MSFRAYLTNPTSIKIDKTYGSMPIVIAVQDATGAGVDLFFSSPAAWADFSEAVRIFDLSLQPENLAA